MEGCDSEQCRGNNRVVREDGAPNCREAHIRILPPLVFQDIKKPCYMVKEALVGHSGVVHTISIREQQRQLMLVSSGT